MNAWHPVEVDRLLTRGNKNIVEFKSWGHMPVIPPQAADVLQVELLYQDVCGNKQWDSMCTLWCNSCSSSWVVSLHRARGALRYYSYLQIILIFCGRLYRILILYMHHKKMHIWGETSVLFVHEYQIYTGISIKSFSSICIGYFCWFSSTNIDDKKLILITSYPWECCLSLNIHTFFFPGIQYWTYHRGHKINIHV